MIFVGFGLMSIVLIRLKVFWGEALVAVSVKCFAPGVAVELCIVGFSSSSWPWSGW